MPCGPDFRSKTLEKTFEKLMINEVVYTKLLILGHIQAYIQAFQTGAAAQNQNRGAGWRSGTTAVKRYRQCAPSDEALGHGPMPNPTRHGSGARNDGYANHRAILAIGVQYQPIWPLATEMKASNPCLINRSRSRSTLPQG